MPLNIIDKDAEDILYASILANAPKSDDKTLATTQLQFLQCRFFQVALNPCAKDIKALLNDTDMSEDTTFYVCEDGDLIIKWDGKEQYETICEKFVSVISKHYGSDIKKYMEFDEFFVDYNTEEDIIKLKNECLKKLKKHTKKTEELSKYFQNELLAKTLRNTLQMTQMQRTFRSKPHILIVEDQVFSQKILSKILSDFTHFIAESSADALLQYVEKCPDIVFLDIELPDLSGHTFAKFINKIDANAYVVMVTGNQYEDDIKTAKGNNVRGFIAKPYKKETILETIEKFKKEKTA